MNYRNIKLTFNPFKEHQISTNVRLVIRDDIKEEFHIIKEVQAKEIIYLNTTDFDSHDYYRYKYQIKDEENGKWVDHTSYNSIVEEQTSDENIKYLYFHHYDSPLLIIVFQALNKTPSYNYIKHLKNIPISKLYIKDDLGPDPTNATYYLGQNKSLKIAEGANKLIEKYRSLNSLDKNKVVCAGSSKGGFASIFQVYFGGYGYAIAGGPQIYLGEYLRKNLKKETNMLSVIYNYLTGTFSDVEKGYLNNILPNLVERKGELVSPYVHIHVGDEEPHYKNHVKPFYDYVSSLGKNDIILNTENYSEHSELATHYPIFLQKQMEQIYETHK